MTLSKLFRQVLHLLLVALLLGPTPLFSAVDMALTMNVGSTGLAFTVHIPETDPAYQWIHQWLTTTTTHELDSIKVPVWQDLVETIFPTGRVPPRTLIMVTRNPWVPAQDVEDNPTNPMVKNPTLWSYPSTGEYLCHNADERKMR